MSAGINIANYEAFLLRFIDGDLSAAEVAGLEDFLEQHPHIRQELQLLQSTVLTPDPQVTFEYKDLLYRGTQEIHAENQTGFLLSYLDNELPLAERTSVEKYIAQTPAAQAELALLQQTRLQPDLNQVFQHKASLYRHRRRVLPVYWWSAGAAAIVAGFMIFIWPSANVQHPGSAGPVAVTAPANAPQHAADPMAAPATTTTNASPALAAATPATQSLPETRTINSTPTAPNSRSTAGNAATATMVAAQRVPASTANTSPEPATSQAPANTNTVITASNDAPVTAPANSSTISRTTSANNVTTATAPSVNPSAAGIAASGQEAANSAPPVMMAMTTAKEDAPANNAIHGELIASVVGTGDNKLLDKVTNVARFFAKKKANNK